MTCIFYKYTYIHVFTFISNFVDTIKNSRVSLQCWWNFKMFRIGHTMYWRKVQALEYLRVNNYKFRHSSQSSILNVKMSKLKWLERSYLIIFPGEILDLLHTVCAIVCMDRISNVRCRVHCLFSPEAKRIGCSTCIYHG